MTTAPTPLHHGFFHRPRLVVSALALVLAAGAVGVLIGRGAFGGSSGSSATQGSGHAVSQVRPAIPFDAVELAGSIPITVHAGAARKVVVHADDNLVANVTTSVDHGRLVVGMRPGSFQAKAPTYVEVTAPSLSAITLSGSGAVSVDGLDVPAFTLNVPGSGVVKASGSATRLDVTLSGSGDAELRGLTAQRVHASVTGSGLINVTATDSLNASVAGSGAILYSGNPPHVLTDITGSGAVTSVG